MTMKMNRQWITGTVALGLALGMGNTGQAKPKQSLFDEGMFLKWQIPYAAINAKYNANLTEAKVEKLLRGAVRISVGGSGSFVSPTGLVYTNHHVASDCINDLRGRGMIPLKGFYDAKDYSQELRCADYAIHTTEGIWDITATVLDPAKTNQTLAEIKSQCEDGMPNIECRITRVGGRESAKQLPDISSGTSDTFLMERLKAYRDVRLVYAPSEERGFLGGAKFNFQFPRFDLDFAFLRVYDESTGGPLDTSAIYLTPAVDKQVEEKDFTMVVGHPGTTSRYLSSWALEFHRDSWISLRRDRLQSMMAQLEATIDTLKPKADATSKLKLKELQSEYFSVANSYQRYQGMLDGLVNSKLIAERRTQETALRKVLQESTLDDATKIAGAEVLDQLEQFFAILKEVYPKYYKSGGADYVREVEFSMATVRQLHTQLDALRQKHLGFSQTYFDANFSQRFSYGAVIGIHEDGGDQVDWATYYSDLNKHAGKQPKLNGRPVSELLEEDKVEFLRREGEKPETSGMVLNFITDNDTTGGNSGSGVFNKDLEVVGALFDGNWRGLVSDYDFDVDPASRSVVVSFKACVQYMKNGDANHRVYKELKAASSR